MTFALASKHVVGKERFICSSALGSMRIAINARSTSLRHLNADQYISGPSEQDYIERQLYADAGIKLNFINYDYPEYSQPHPPFDPQVTILDLLFMVGDEAPKYMTGSLTS